MRAFWGTKQALPGPLGTWSYQEIFISALEGSAWPEFSRRLSLGLLAEAHSNEIGEELDERMVRKAAEAYRRSEGLLTAEETEAWLISQDLAAEDWEQFLIRGLLVSHHGARLSERAVDLSGHAAFGEAFFAEAVFSDFLPDARMRFSKWLAIAAEGPALDFEDAPFAAAALAVRYPWLGEVSPHGVARVNAIATRAAGAIAAATSTQKIEAVLADRGLAWTQLECFEVSLRDARVGREIALCARREGHPMVPVLARRLGLCPKHQTFLLESAPKAARGELEAAQPGSLVGPVRDGDVWKLYQLIARRPPSVHEAETVALARQVLERQMMEAAWVRSCRRQVTGG